MIDITWVEAEPGREIGVDPLRLDYFTDRLASRILPDISVLTPRARYLSFLCWAIRKTERARDQSAAVHELEGELALFEAKRHTDRADCPTIVGRLTVQRRLEKDGRVTKPHRYFKVSALAQYRALMRATGLITTPRRRAQLTPLGKKLGASYGRISCLSQIPKTESRILAAVLGLDRRRGSSRLARRYDVLAELRELDLTSPADALLARYARRPRSTSTLELELHRAYVWNIVFRGLRLAFLRFMPLGSGKESSRSKLRAITRALRARTAALSPINLDAVALDEEEWATQVVAHLRTALFLAEGLSLDEDVLRIVATLVANRARDPMDFVQALFVRHRQAKGLDLWATIDARGRVQRIAPPKKQIPSQVGSLGYRVAEFTQLARDLGRL